MSPEAKEQLIQHLKREPISIPSAGNTAMQYNRADIERILPHRGSFALLDKIVLLNPEEQLLLTETIIRKDNPVFEGHFPGDPLYPGVLQIEMMGQAGLCLIYFLLNQTDHIAASSKPVKGLFTRVHNAGFIHPVLPGDVLQVRARMVEYDDFLGIMMVQVWKDEILCSHSILEAYLMDT